MARWGRGALALAAVLMLAGAARPALAQVLSPQAPPSACDRACLSGVLDSYLEALKAHDPLRLPLAPDVRFTENGVPLSLPDGLWKTIDKVDAYRLPFLDEEAGQAGMYGVVEEDGHAAHLMVRLKVEGGKITEIETIVLRPAENGGFGAPETMKRREPFYQDVPPDERLTRTQLVSMANAYFETLQQNNGTLFATFGDDCNRIESGVQTTNRTAPLHPGPNDPGIAELGCAAAFRTGYFRFVTHIRDRRFVIADPQKGLVYAAAFFDHTGDMRKVRLTDGRIVDAQYDHPKTWQIGELFKVRGGKLHEIEALVMNAPYGLQDVWTDHPQWKPAH